MAVPWDERGSGPAQQTHRHHDQAGHQRAARTHPDEPHPARAAARGVGEHRPGTRGRPGRTVAERPRPGADRRPRVKVQARAAACGIGDYRPAGRGRSRVRALACTVARGLGLNRPGVGGRPRVRALACTVARGLGLNRPGVGGRPRVRIRARVPARGLGGYWPGRGGRPRVRVPMSGGRHLGGGNGCVTDSVTPVRSSPREAIGDPTRGRQHAPVQGILPGTTPMPVLPGTRRPRCVSGAARDPGGRGCACRCRLERAARGA
jgi:hypothetical protein